MITGKTSTGFEFEIKEDTLDDYELMELVAESDTGDIGAFIEMVKVVLGHEQKERLKEHVRDLTGKVSAKSMAKEIAEILRSSAAGKN